MSNSINRRKFIKISSVAGLGLGVVGSAANVLGSPSPNSRITVAVMGVNGRGISLARGFVQHEHAEVAYICDVDDMAIKKGVDAVREAGQTRTPEGIKDFRKALEDPALDALVLATPIHWHAPASILALKAGKHVYVEKPCSHNLHEGELLVNAAIKYRRVVQMGNQRRSDPVIQEAIQKLKEGVIGNTYFARAWYTNSRGSIGYGKSAPVPSNIDYDLWQGPAPRRNYKDNLVHYNWHWHWHWGGGELANNGIHRLDLIRWGLGVDYPTRVSSNGGRYHWQDDQETPDTQITTFDYPGGKTAVWEARSCNPQRSEGHRSGILFYGDNGSMLLAGSGHIVYDNDNEEIERVAGSNVGRVHVDNFIESIRSGIRANSDISDANISVHNCHLGNIAHRTNRMIHCDIHDGRIIGDAEAMKYWKREYEPGWEPTV